MTQLAQAVNLLLTRRRFLAILPISADLTEGKIVTVQILGSGCAKCQLLEKNAKEAVARLGVNARVVKVTDMDKIVDMGVMVTPALAIDGTVKKAGAVLSVDQIAQILKAGA